MSGTLDCKCAHEVVCPKNTDLFTALRSIEKTTFGPDDEAFWKQVSSFVQKECFYRLPTAIEGTVKKSS